MLVARGTSPEVPYCAGGHRFGAATGARARNINEINQMAAMFQSLIRALGVVAVSIVVVALLWTIYINRESVADIAAPVVTPLVDSIATTEASPDSSSVEGAAGELAK